MSRYRVGMSTIANITVTVEADSPKDAIEKAYDELPGSICAQCSGWGQNWSLDMGEWEPDDDLPEVDE